MSVEGELFTSLKALYDADTGASGLKNSASTANLVGGSEGGFVNYDNPEWRGTNNNFPMVAVEIPDQASQDTFTIGGYIAYVRFHCFFRRDQGLTTVNAVMDRMRTVFHRTELANQTTWVFSSCVGRRVVKGPSSDIELHRIIEAKVMCQKSSGGM